MPFTLILTTNAVLLAVNWLLRRRIRAGR